MENIKLSKIVKVSVFLTLAGVVFLLFVNPILLSLVIKYIPYDFQPSLYTPEKIYAGKVFKQNVVAMEDGLTGVGLSIKNPNLRNKDDIVLSIFDDEILLSRVNVSGTVIPDGDLVKFIFPRIDGSRGKNYSFTFSTDAEESVESFSLYLTDQEVEWLGDIFIEGKKEDNPISLVTYYHPKTKIELVILIYNKWFTKLVSDKLFFTLYVLILSGLTTSLLLVKRK